MTEPLMAHVMPVAEGMSECAAPDERCNRCAHCGRPFGLLRHRLAAKQLCSQACMTAEAEQMQRALQEKVRRLTLPPARG